MRHFPRIVVALSLMALALSACGQKGPLKQLEPAAAPASAPAAAPASPTPNPERK